MNPKDLPAPPAFNPFRLRIEVPVSPTLTLVCLAPTATESLESAAALRVAEESGAHTSDEDLAAHCERSLWAHLVGVRLSDESGSPIEAPADWREQLAESRSISGLAAIEPWGFLFRDLVLDRFRRRRSGPPGAGSGQGNAKPRGRRRAAQLR